MNEDQSSEMNAEHATSTDATSDRRRGKLPISTKLVFSSGAIQMGMLGAAGITTLLFYNQVLGLSPSLCGLAFLISSIADAVSDPVIGTISDRYQSRWGRRHPFMLMSSLPFAISIYFLYQPVDDLGGTGLFIWLTSTSVLMRLAYTFFNVPYFALGAELTDNYHERTSLFGWVTVTNGILSFGLSIVVLWVLFPTTLAYENGLLNEGRYPHLAIMSAVVVLFSVVVCVFGTRHHIPYLHATDSDRPDVKAILANIGKLIVNPSYIAVCASWLTISAGMGVFGVVGLYTWIYCYGVSSEQLAILTFIKLPGSLIVVPLSAFMTRWLDKRGTVVVISLVSAGFIASPHVARLFGFFPNSDAFLYLPLLFGSVFIGTMIDPVLGVVADSQLVDVCDDHELKTGVRAEGVVFSIRTFAMKATAGLGGFIGGVGLEIIGFPRDAGAEALSQEVINGLLIINGPFFFLIYAVGAVFMWMYRLNASTHGEILTELQKRRTNRES